jgi:hypothetical protein
MKGEKYTPAKVKKDNWIFLNLFSIALNKSVHNILYARSYASGG